MNDTNSIKKSGIIPGEN